MLRNMTFGERKYRKIMKENNIDKMVPVPWVSVPVHTGTLQVYTVPYKYHSFVPPWHTPFLKQSPPFCMY